MRLNPGDLKHRVTIQQLTPEEDATGFPTDEWSTLLDKVPIMSEIEKASEQFAVGKESASLVTRWTMPYVASMDAYSVNVPKTRRIVYQGRVYDIISAETIGRKEAIVLRTLANTAVAA